MRTVLLGLFAGLALLLALVGTYGVISLVVTQRAREMGIRLALGASRPDIVRLIVGGGLRPIAAGGILGLAAALAADRALAGLLFQISPADPTTSSSVITIIVITSVVATWIPARRACRVGPVTALRAE